MTRSKKKFLIISLAVLLLISVVYYGYTNYLKNKLDFSFSKMITYDSDMQLKFLSYAYSGEMPENFRNKLLEIDTWNEKIIYDVTRNHTAPMNIDISGNVVDGKTVLRYFGTATTKDGEQVDYLEEQVFDFVLVPDEKLPKPENYGS